MVMAVVVSGCATPYDPFKVPVAQVRETVDTVAIRPLHVGSGVDADVEWLRERIEPRAASILRDAGYSVVPPEEWERRWLEAATQVGEIWDPDTGVVDEERFDVVRSVVLHDLAADAGVDAVVQLRIYVVELENPITRPVFCGHQDWVYWPGSGLSLLSRVTLAYAACLDVRIDSMDSRKLYSIRSGLEVLDTYARQTHARRPTEERLRDSERLDEALSTILEGFAEARSGD